MSEVVLNNDTMIENLLKGNLDESSSRLEQPKDIMLELRPHQLTQLKSMKNLEEFEDIVNSGLRIGIFADRVGSGKSITILSHISNNPIYISKRQTNFMKGITSYKGEGREYDDNKIIKSNLIVVPHTIIHQWEEYIRKYTKLNSYFINRTSDLYTKDNIWKYNNYDVVVCKSSIYNKLSHILENTVSLYKNPNYYNFLNKHYIPYNLDQIQDLQNQIYDVSKYEMCRTRVQSDPFYIVSSTNKIKHYTNKFYELTHKLKSCLDEFDYVSIKNEYFNNVRETKNIKQYKGYIWYRVIFDEPDTLNIPQCGSVYGFFNWYICSSYENLIFPNGKKYGNNVYVSGLHKSGYIRDTFREIYYYNHVEEQMKNYFLKNKDEYIENSLKGLLNQLEYSYWKCNTPREVILLDGLINDELIQNLNAGDLKGVISKINCNIKTEDNLIKLYTDKWDQDKQKLESKINEILIILNIYSKIYSKRINGLDFTGQQLLEYVGNKIANININDSKKKWKTCIQNRTYLNIQNKILAIYDNAKISSIFLNKIQELNKEKNGYKTKINLLENQINCLKNRLQDVSYCPICLDDIKNKINLICCKNNMCLECILCHLKTKQTCPLCRAKIDNVDKFILVHDEHKSKKSCTNVLKDKDEVLVDLIKKIIFNKQESHILVFSEHDNSFEKLYSVLDQNDISYMKLHGSNSRIQNILKKYEEGVIKILFLNARHQGSGINLESTTDLVFYHRMSKEMEKQVIGRGYRIGRYNKLDVHFLLHDNERDYDKSNNLYEGQGNQTLEI